MTTNKVNWGIVDLTQQTEGGQARTSSEMVRVKDRYETPMDLRSNQDMDVVHFPLMAEDDKEWMMAAIEAQKHIHFSEVLSMREETLTQIVHHCEKHDVFLMDDMCILHSPFNRIKSVIQQGTIGEVRMVKGTMSEVGGMSGDQGESHQVIPSGVMRTLGWRCVSIIRILLDGEPESVIASGMKNDSGTETTVSAILNFPGQVHAVFHCSMDVQLPNYFEVIGTKGTIKLSISDSNRGTITIQNGSGSEEMTFSKHGFASISYFILQKKNPPYSGRFILNTLKTVEAIVRSLNDQSKITLKRTGHPKTGWGEECGIAALLKR